MNSWLEINLPWNVRLEQETSFLYPDLSVEMKEKFGYTERELVDKMFPESGGYYFDNPIFKEFKELRDQFDGEDKDIVNSKLKAMNNVSVNIVLEYKARKKEIDNWIESHPDSIKACDENDKIHKAHKEKQSKLSFTGMGLNKSGTVIEFIEDGKVQQLLIGNLNEAGGICDDCRGVSNETIILRYKKVWENEHVEIVGNCQV